MVDIEDLKAKALEATPGEWTLRDRGVICGGPLVQYFKGQGRPQIVMCCGGEHIGHEQKTANERFIAAAHPDAVLRLIDRLEKSEAERDSLKAENGKLKFEADLSRHTIESLQSAYSHMTKLKDSILARLKAARNQEPCGYMCEDAGITKIYNAAKCTGDFSKHTPVYKSPVPARKGTDMQCTCGHKWISFDPQENCPRCNPAQQMPDDERYAVDPIYDKGEYYITGKDINAIIKGGEND